MTLGPGMRLRTRITLAMRGEAREKALQDLAELERALLDAHLEIEEMQGYKAYQETTIQGLLRRLRLIP